MQVPEDAYAVALFPSCCYGICLREVPMKFTSQPRTVITGGGSGLGRAIALQLAPLGARILIADLHAERADETAHDIEKAGGKAVTVTCDVADAAQVDALSARMDKEWLGTDILVNNAGVACAGGVGELPLEDWKWILGINMWGVVHGCHSFAPGMKARRSGYILNVASSAGIASLPEMGAYNVSKAAVISLSETLHAELNPHNVHVSALCPTFFKTNLLESFRSPDERQRKFAHLMFERSTMTADQVAREALEGLSQNRLMVIPQKDGKALWRVKRFSPALYFRGVIAGYRKSLGRKGGTKTKTPV